MWKNGNSQVNTTNLNSQFMAGLVMGLACLGVLYFLLESNLATSTIEPGSDFENFELNETTLDMIQTNTTESLHDIYYQIKVGNTIRPIMISSYENLVSNINYDSEEKSIVLVISSLNAKADNLVIDIPRIILDSKANGIDKNFTVMVDDQPARFLELSNSNEEKRISNSITNNTSATQLSNNTESRKLIVEFEPNTKIIKISGTDTSNSVGKNNSTLEDNSRFFIPILADNNIENLSLQLNGGTLMYVQLTTNSKDNKTLFLSISPYNNNGRLVIDIPRIILDSKANGIDKNFTVMVDDQPARFLELSNSNEEKRISNSITNNTSATQLSNNTESRKLIVEFEPNTKIIKISGTDTSNSNNQSKTENKKSNLIMEGDKGSIDTIFPIVLAIAISGSVLLYFFYRKNKLPLFKKLQRQNR